MSGRRLQVFVSSTFEDLKDERKAAVEAIFVAGQIPAGMELFTAGDQSQWTIIEKWIGESDAYMLLAGGRYGSTFKGKSYTQREFELAGQLNKPRFSLVASKTFLDNSAAKGDIDPASADYLAAEQFRTLVSKGAIVNFFDNRDMLKTQTILALKTIIDDKSIPGWVRATVTSAPPLLFPDIYQVGHGYLPDVEDAHSIKAIKLMAQDKPGACLRIGSPYLRYWLAEDPRLEWLMENTSSIRLEVGLYEIIESADQTYDRSRTEFILKAKAIETRYNGRLVFKTVPRKTDLSYVTYPLSAGDGRHCRAMVGFQSPRYSQRPFIEFIYPIDEPPPLIRAVEAMHQEAFGAT